MCALAPLALALVAPEPSSLSIAAGGLVCMAVFAFCYNLRKRKAGSYATPAEPTKRRGRRPLPTAAAFTPRKEG
jgi:hypothetical protein